MTKKPTTTEASCRKTTHKPNPKEQTTRRGGRASTKSVSTLTTAQLERKRANDREAQRTIRQRTKEHIESLERQVAELNIKREQLDKALQRNAALESEIGLLRRQLAGAGASNGYGHASGSPIPRAPASNRKKTDIPAVGTDNHTPPSRRSISPTPGIHSTANPGSAGAPLVNQGWSSYALTPSPSNESTFSSGGFGDNDSHFVIPTTSIDQNLYAPMMQYGSQRPSEYASMHMMYPNPLHNNVEHVEWDGMV